jgi:hypothetical protein
MEHVGEKIVEGGGGRVPRVRGHTPPESLHANRRRTTFPASGATPSATASAYSSSSAPDSRTDCSAMATTLRSVSVAVVPACPGLGAQRIG